MLTTLEKERLTLTPGKKYFSLIYPDGREFWTMSAWDEGHARELLKHTIDNAPSLVYCFPDQPDLKPTPQNVRAYIKEQGIAWKKE